MRHCEKEKLKEENIVTSVEETKEELGKTRAGAVGDWLNDLSVPGPFRGDVRTLVEENKDLFAQTDAELGHIDTVRMKSDTGKHRQIKMKPCKTPLNKKKVIVNAIHKMLEAGFIQRSQSPWSLPVVM